MMQNVRRCVALRTTRVLSSCSRRAPTGRPRGARQYPVPMQKALRRDPELPDACCIGLLSVDGPRFLGQREDALGDRAIHCAHHGLQRRGHDIRVEADAVHRDLLAHAQLDVGDGRGVFGLQFFLRIESNEAISGS